ncbi:hypothetical protein Zmor_003792 [Zophobas morio]|uniref:Uncharacterized protein n=1 Tax=Zophobas morio TaxID=2755281 RepID=A0AA38HST7_9CUCU|nr:hypothetical protein Zmor_003792 [Zophobas morio]
MYNDHIDKIVPSDLLDKQDLPRIVISVSVIGILFLITNIVLVAGCILKRRAKRIREQNNQTRTSATIEICAPNSHNDTVTDETLSSFNEKSETYNKEESNNDCVVTFFEGTQAEFGSPVVAVLPRDGDSILSASPPPSTPLSNDETSSANQAVTVANSWLEITAIKKLTVLRRPDRSSDFYTRPASFVQVARQIPPGRLGTPHSASATFSVSLTLNSILNVQFI